MPKRLIPSIPEEESFEQTLVPEQPTQQTAKVAAAFICDDIDSLNCLQSLAVFDETELPKETEKFVNESCLTFKELFDYGKNVGALYGWHVASTQPLDKKLSDFGLKRPPQSWQYVRISV